MKKLIVNENINEVYLPLINDKSRYFILMGGRGAGRSTIASQYAVAKLSLTDYFRCAIMRYILGDIRNSIYREIIDRATDNGAIEAFDINEGAMVINYLKNSINAVGFKKSSGDQKAKLKSLANYNCVIIEEADEIPEEDFMQLDDSLRTMKGDIKIIFLLNPPPKSHWIIRRWFDLEQSEIKDFYIPKLKTGITDTTFIRTSYLDNIKNISPQTIKNYEGYKTSKPSHYYNMVKGYVPEVVRGKIYKNWQELPELPIEARLIGRGLDYGYSNDPTALADLYKWNDAFILDERLYAKEMSNKMIAMTIKNSKDPSQIVVADSAEPKSNDELSAEGVTVIPAVKGADSVAFGIGVVQNQKIFYTKRSTNIKREYDNYAWLEDKEGNGLNVPKPGQADHLMDAARYIIVTVCGQTEETEEDKNRQMAESRRNLRARPR